MMFEGAGVTDLFVAKNKDSAVDYVINSIKGLLIQKKLLPGDMLPSETELSEQLNVGRGSVREAMKILQAYGVVEVKRGDGTYVCASVADSLIEPFLFNLILSQPEVNDLVELRQMLETQIVRQILQHNDQDQIAGIVQAHAAMQQAMAGNSDAAAVLACDIQFHDTLAKASRNELIYRIYHFVLDLFSPYIEKTYKHSRNSDQAYAYHDEIVNAILAGDLSMALKAIQASIEGWRTVLYEDH